MRTIGWHIGQCWKSSGQDILILLFFRRRLVNKAHLFEPFQDNMVIYSSFNNFSRLEFFFYQKVHKKFE